MKYCQSCKISVDAPNEHCPLCYSTLKGDSSELVPKYPNLTVNYDKYSLLLRILIFASIAIVAVSVTIDFFVPTRYSWSWVVVASILYTWIAVGTAVKKHKKIGFNLMMQAISLSVLIIVLGFIFEFSYFVFNYILPAFFISAMLSFNILAVIKSKDIKNLILYHLIISFLGFVPILFYVLKLSRVAWPVASSAVCSILSILAMFVFAYNETKTELKKRFHI